MKTNKSTTTITTTTIRRLEHESNQMNSLNMKLNTQQVHDSELFFFDIIEFL